VHVDERGNLAERGFDDDAARGGRAHVARSDRRGRVDDDGRQPIAFDHALDGALGQHFTALVDADGLLCGQRGRFVGDTAFARNLQRGDAACVDDALDAFRERGPHRRLGAFQVGALDFGGIGGPEPVIGGYVKQISHAAQRGAHRLLVAHIADDDLCVERFEVFAWARGAHERSHAHSACERRAGDGGADEARRARDEHEVA
jgi:hypothetical protein